MRSFSFENLIVWQKSKDLAIHIYKVTKQFPKEELYGLTSQLRRASVSITSNLAEGTSRNTNKEKARFSTIVFQIIDRVPNVRLQFYIGLNLLFPNC
ncbi:MAG: four helix bundle protein [Bacteroidota bacterium]